MRTSGTFEVEINALRRVTVIYEVDVQLTPDESEGLTEEDLVVEMQNKAIDMTYKQNLYKESVRFISKNVMDDEDIVYAEPMYED